MQLFMLWAMGCEDTLCEVGDEPAGTKDSGGGDVADTAPTDSGEAAGDDLALEVTAVISEQVHTVVIVTWKTAETTSGRVEFGPDSAYGNVTNTTAAGTEHRVLLLGLPADTPVHFRVVLDTGTAEVATSDYEITTLSLPSGMPQPVVSGEVTDQWAYQVLPIQGSVQYVTMVDAEGRVVWYYQPTSGGNLMKAVLTHDRQHMLLGHAGNQGDLAASKLEFISLDGYDVRTVETPQFDHDLAELPDGTVALIMVDSRTKEDGSPWSADAIVELAPDGSFTEIFNAWDQIDPSGLGLENFQNWTHGNGIDYVASEDCYYLSMKELGSIAKIPRTTGVPEWIVNGKVNQFEFLDGAVPGYMQHQFEVLGDGHILLFDNGPPERGYSRAAEIQLDFDAMTATELWEYIRVPPVYVYAKGDVHRFADESTQVTWSTSGELQLVDASGGLLWQMNLPLGNATTFVQPVQSLYEDR